MTIFQAALIFLAVVGLAFHFRSPKQQAGWLLFTFLSGMLFLDDVSNFSTAAQIWFREVVIEKGLYAYRRPVQTLFVIEVIIVVWLVARSMRPGLSRGVQYSLAGMIILVVQRLLKLVSFHYVDQTLALSVRAFSVGDAILFSGVILLMRGVMLEVKHPPSCRAIAPSGLHPATDRSS